MAVKLGQLIKSAAVVLCAVMMLECASAGFVWAEAEEPKAENIQSNVAADEEDVDWNLQEEPDLTIDSSDTSIEGSSDISLNEDTPEDPEPLNGWVDTEEGRMYVVDDVALTGFQEVDGCRYYFDQSGIMQTGLVKVDGNTYYFGDDGIMQTGMAEIGGKRYYFNDEGVMQTGMVQVEKSWYYFNKKGVMQTGWKTIKKKKYYFDPESGIRQRGKKTIDGAVYYFDKDGVMATGWLKVKGKKYYHDPKTGVRIFKSKKIGKYYYYFKPKSGIMKTGWLKLKGKSYYYDSKGRKRFGVIKVKGKTYYLNLKTGAKMSKGSYYLYKPVWNKSSRTRYLIYVDKKKRYVTVYKGKIRNWTVVKRFRCSIGKPSTPTPSGTYHISSKVSHFGESKGYSVWYASGFIGTTYLIHSVVCYRGTKRVSDGRLGMAISHGCIRVAMGNAKWIYNHVGGGTTVYIK